MMKEFCIEIDVGEARPLSFFSSSSSPVFLVDFLALEVNLDGEAALPVLFPPGILDGDEAS